MFFSNPFSLYLCMLDKYIYQICVLAQAPRPVITSVNATATKLNVTWNKGHWHSTKCQIRYRCSTEQWTVVKRLLQKSVKVFF